MTEAPEYIDGWNEDQLRRYLLDAAVRHHERFLIQEYVMPPDGESDWYAALQVPANLPDETAPTVSLSARSADRTEALRNLARLSAQRDEQSKPGISPDEARRQLERLGIPTGVLSDAQTIEMLRQIFLQGTPPAIRAGTPPINGRAWLAATLTVGRFVQPEDREQMADLGDGGPPVPLGALAILVMRHLPNARPQEVVRKFVEV